MKLFTLDEQIKRGNWSLAILRKRLLSINNLVSPATATTLDSARIFLELSFLVLHRLGLKISRINCLRMAKFSRRLAFRWAWNNFGDWCNFGDFCVFCFFGEVKPHQHHPTIKMIFWAIFSLLLLVGRSESAISRSHFAWFHMSVVRWTRAQLAIRNSRRNSIKPLRLHSTSGLIVRNGSQSQQSSG